MSEDIHRVGDHRDPVRFDASTPPIEWAIALLGAAIAVALVGVLVWSGVTGGDEPPAFTVEVGTPVEMGGAWRVPVAVANVGGTAAADVVLVGRLVRDGREVERSTVTLDHVAAGAVERAGLVFGTDPRGLELAVTPAGYTLP